MCGPCDGMEVVEFIPIVIAIVRKLGGFISIVHICTKIAIFEMELDEE
jgi:hypothetical protein